ncbi:MAG: nucleotidyltransferase family protein [Thermodesulfobacteriota bacterium]|nr:MAG: nucleotidyltransferase family protein [Thermodesulfobacteriota bacterium]
MNTELKTIKNKLSEYKLVLEEQYKVKEIGVFGSFVRGEQKKKSDLDILVDFYEPISLLNFIRLENNLSKYLGINVDLVMKNALKPRIGSHILKEVVNI